MLHTCIHVYNKTKSKNSPIIFKLPASMQLFPPSAEVVVDAAASTSQSETGDMQTTLALDFCLLLSLDFSNLLSVVVDNDDDSLGQCVANDNDDITELPVGGHLISASFVVIVAECFSGH